MNAEFFSFLIDNQEEPKVSPDHLFGHLTGLPFNDDTVEIQEEVKSDIAPEMREWMRKHLRFLSKDHPSVCYRAQTPGIFVDQKGTVWPDSATDEHIVKYHGSAWRNMRSMFTRIRSAEPIVRRTLDWSFGLNFLGAPSMEVTALLMERATTFRYGANNAALAIRGFRLLHTRTISIEAAYTSELKHLQK